MKKHENNKTTLDLDKLNKLLELLINIDNKNKYKIWYFPHRTHKIQIREQDKILSNSPYEEYKSELGYFASLGDRNTGMVGRNWGTDVDNQVFISAIESYLENSIKADASPDSVSSVISENDLQNNSQMSQSSEKYSQKDEIAFQFDSSKEVLGVLIASGVTLFSIASLTGVIPLILPSLAILIAGIISLSYLGYKMYQYSGFFKFDENKMVPVISSSNSTLSF